MAALLRTRRVCDVATRSRWFISSSSSSGGAARPQDFVAVKGAPSLDRRHHSTTTEAFYHRELEMRQLRAIAQHGKLLLLTGPEDAGKSALLSQFVHLQKTCQIPYPILIDMRGGTFHNSAAFCKALKAQSGVVAASILDGLRHAVRNLSGDGLFYAVKNLVMDIEGLQTRMQQTDDLNGLLDALYSLLSTYRRCAKTFRPGHAAGFPSLIIDEANCLREWPLDPTELEGLQALHRFFIKVTKQDKIANVILATSEDFFSFYLDSHVGAARYATGVVGDLLKDDAFEFFQTALEKEGGVSVPTATWDDIFDVLGGRVLLLQQLAEESLSFDDPLASRWDELKLEFLSRALLGAKKGFHPSFFPPKWKLPPASSSSAYDVSEGLFKDSSPAWTERDWANMVRRMSEAPLGVVALDDLDAQIPRKAVFSMVQHNLIHYRREPCLRWARDLAEYTGAYPIVMPKSRPHYKACCQLVAEMR